MRFIRLLSWANLGVAGLSCLIANVASSQSNPAVRALWVLPTQFKDGADVTPQPDFATRGKEFLAAFRKRAPALSSPEILEGADVTRTNVLDKLDASLQSLTAPGSILVFYYAGHGVRPGRSSSDGVGSRRSTYLAMQNCQVGDAKVTHDETMLLLEEIMSVQSNYPGVYFLGYIDSCYSGNESFPADRLFWSETLGPRGFLLCSSGSDRKSYSPDFTKALTAVYERDELFNKIHTPNDLLEQLKNSYVFATEQVPQLIPDGCPLQITYPLPGLCFYCIDFGGTISYPITVKITPPDGHPMSLTFNNQRNGIAPPEVASVAFPVQQVNNTTIAVNFTSAIEYNFKADLVGVPFYHKSLKDFKVPNRRILDADAGSARLAAAEASFQSLVNHAKRFGLSDSSLTEFCEPVLVSQFGQLNAAKSARFISNQVAFLAQKAPSSPDVNSLRLLAGLGDVDQYALDDFKQALKIGVPVSPQFERAYADITARVSKSLSEEHDLVITGWDPLYTGHIGSSGHTTGTYPRERVAPGGGHGLVWVNPQTRVYHREGTAFYGNTRIGKFITEEEAIKEGYRQSR